jgi:hypothetical protein
MEMSDSGRLIAGRERQYIAELNCVLFLFSQINYTCEECRILGY